MATKHTLNMATSGVARVCLYGHLQRFGQRFDLSINTGAEAIRALSVQIQGFKSQMMQGWYQIRITGQDISPDDMAQRLHEPLPEGAIIHIVPRMAGAGWWKKLRHVVIGAIAIGIAFWSGGASIAAWGALEKGLFALGASMVLGGVSQMLAPKPPSPNQTDNGKQNTYFSCLDNMTAQGSPVPVIYGEMMVGSRVISQEISTRDEGLGGKVVVIGR
ncbi:TPA: tail assembly protein [Yersinia enterocolitica]|uniref:tail assembly protein n=1 Tax=Yersinia enterocolitica TaxID=630 RepID=UPI0005FCDD58|nr:tail assembly protein [Yersinia enterocolitica]EKN5934729.1 tail assembly protein [Yersinia enterocolitica]CRE96445.1 putative phage tail protein [Yersinia enterocolitica]HDL7351072.1 tail assembly protein [Yersinia enterocolitica]